MRNQQYQQQGQQQIKYNFFGKGGAKNQSVLRHAKFLIEKEWIQYFNNGWRVAKTEAMTFEQLLALATDSSLFHKEAYEETKCINVDAYNDEFNKGRTVYAKNLRDINQLQDLISKLFQQGIHHLTLRFAHHTPRFYNRDKVYLIMNIQKAENGIKLYSYWDLQGIPALDHNSSEFKDFVLNVFKPKFGASFTNSDHEVIKETLNQWKRS